MGAGERSVGADAQSTDADAQSTDAQSTDAQATDAQATDPQSTGPQSSEAGLAERTDRLVPGEAEHAVSEPEHGHAEVAQAAGRVSVAREVLLSQPPRTPFSRVQLARLDEALTLASRDAEVRFTIHLGPLGPDPRARAEELHAMLGSAAADAVVIAVSPGERVVEIVTGEESGARLPDRACKLAAMRMVASFAKGDLIGGLITGLRLLADQADQADQADP